jgi:cellulose biosynthesis protein BcsQ
MVKVYNTRIPLSVKVEEANYNQSAISQTSKNHKVAKAYKEFTQEVLNG